nr:MAG TPA: hypothetical protein [Caudoviricetes sp.]
MGSGAAFMPSGTDGSATFFLAITISSEREGR